MIGCRAAGRPAGPASRRLRSVPASTRPGDHAGLTAGRGGEPRFRPGAARPRASSSTRCRAGVIRSGGGPASRTPTIGGSGSSAPRRPQHHAQHHAARRQRVVGDPVDEGPQVAWAAAARRSFSTIGRRRLWPISGVRRIVPDDADHVAGAERHLDDIAGRDRQAVGNAIAVGPGDRDRQEDGNRLGGGQRFFRIRGCYGMIAAPTMTALAAKEKPGFASRSGRLIAACAYAFGRGRRPFETSLDPFTPARPAHHCIRVGSRKIARPVLGQDRDQQFRLRQVLRRLGAVGSLATAVGYDQLVDREPLGPGYLDQNAVAIDGGRLDRLGDEVVQVVQGLRTDAEGRKFANFFLFLE